MHHVKVSPYIIVVLYIRDHEGLGFLAKNITLKPASQYYDVR